VPSGVSFTTSLSLGSAVEEVVGPAAIIAACGEGAGEVWSGDRMANTKAGINSVSGSRDRSTATKVEGSARPSSCSNPINACLCFGNPIADTLILRSLLSAIHDSHGGN
jgi:hypothetical protein